MTAEGVVIHRRAGACLRAEFCQMSKSIDSYSSPIIEACRNNVIATGQHEGVGGAKEEAHRASWLNATQDTFSFAHRCRSFETLNSGLWNSKSTIYSCNFAKTNK